MNKNSAIGIFDSGLGGLTVLKKIQQLLPNENYIYFGDTAHLPYGSKSHECIIEYSEKIVKFLISKNVKAIIIACNSASSVAKDIIQAQTNIPIFEVISPAVESAVQMTKNNKIAVIGTEATISSKIYSKKISKINTKIKTQEISCPLFVPIIEEGLEHFDFTRQIVQLYLNLVIDLNIDTLILGCTHYPIIKDQLSNILPDNISYISSGSPVGEWLKQYLFKNKLLNTNNSSSINFYVSDAPEKFQKLGSKFLNNQITDIKLIQID